MKETKSASPIMVIDKIIKHWTTASVTAYECTEGAFTNQGETWDIEHFDPESLKLFIGE